MNKVNNIFNPPLINFSVLLIVTLVCSVIFNNISYSFNQNGVLLYEVVNPGANSNKALTFEGSANNNYLVYNNLLWRIVKVNPNGSILIILDKSINILPHELNEDFSINDYLNTKFKNQLDLTYLTPNRICLDDVDNLNNVKCEVVSNDYVNLLDLNTFVGTLKDNVSFISEDHEYIWLSNRSSDNYAWHIFGNKISKSKNSNFYEVKPVVTIKNTVLYESGEGSLEKPFVVGGNTFGIGSIVKLDNDYYTVFDTENDIKLVLNNSLMNKYNYQGDVDSIYVYLNDNFYNNLNYKSIIKSVNYPVYDITNDNLIKADYKRYVGIQSIMDLKVNDDVDYFLATTYMQNIMVYDNPIVYGTKRVMHSLKPCITVSKDLITKLEYKDGVFTYVDA